MPFKASRLQRDGFLLNRAKVDVRRLKPDDVRIGAELLRRLISIPEASKHRGVAMEAWQEFRTAKGV
jgi:hypothetical protein